MMTLQRNFKHTRDTLNDVCRLVDDRARREGEGSSNV